MAETTGILNNKKFLVSIYLLILFFIGIFIALLIFLYNDNKNLYSEDYEEYHSIQNDIDQLKDDYSNQIIFIATLESSLSSQEPSKEILETVILAQNQAISINNQIIFRNERILELDLENEELEKSKAEIEVSYDAIKLHQEAISKLEERISVLNFSSDLNQSLSCYQKINTDSSSATIRSAVEKCAVELEKSRNLIPAKPEDLPITHKYLDEIENYWTITINLNVKLEEKNEAEANQLKDQLNRSIETRTTLETQSSEELKEFVK